MLEVLHTLTRELKTPVDGDVLVTASTPRKEIQLNIASNLEEIWSPSVRPRKLFNIFTLSLSTTICFVYFDWHSSKATGHRLIQSKVAKDDVFILQPPEWDGRTD